MVAEIEARNRVFENTEAVSLPELNLNIPVYDFRNLNDQAEVARRLARGAQMAMFGGIWGGFKGVSRNTENESFFHKVKVDRPKEAKIAMMISPGDSIKMVDWSAVHPDFQNLQSYQKYKDLWSSHRSYLHIIAPVRQSLESLPDVFKTTPEDYAARYPGEKGVDSTTACFFWREDPYLHHMSALVKRFSHTDTYLGVTSLNKHGQNPASSYQEFLSQIEDDKVDLGKFHLIVRDSIYENSEALGSHTQVRLPLKGEEPVLTVLRIGVLSPEGFAQAADLPTKVIPTAKDVRVKPGINVDNAISLNNGEITKQWSRQKPQIFFIS